MKLHSLVLCLCLGLVAPHGRLTNPPQRSSMWRYGYDTEVNNDDNGLNCGGVGIQYSSTNRGRCGVCGDPWNSPVKQNEAGGKYAKGIITKTYRRGGIMDVGIYITANHKGYFILKICPHNSPAIPVQQRCLDRYPLLMTTPNGVSYKYFLSPNVKQYSTQVRLPATLTCTQCVIQWTYVAQNSWGCDGSICGLGNGNQEHFVNCADIAITSEGHNPLPVTGRPPTQRTTHIPATFRPNPFPYADRPTPPPTTQRPQATHRPQVTQRPQIVQKPQLTNLYCRAVGPWTGQQSMIKWCQKICAAGQCPNFLCSCTRKTTITSVKTCAAVGIWRKTPGMNTWCRSNCNHTPSYCPASHCSCY